MAAEFQHAAGQQGGGSDGDELPGAVGAGEGDDGAPGQSVVAVDGPVSDG